MKIFAITVTQESCDNYNEAYYLNADTIHTEVKLIADLPKDFAKHGKHTLNAYMHNYYIAKTHGETVIGNNGCEMINLPFGIDKIEEQYPFLKETYDEFKRTTDIRLNPSLSFLVLDETIGNNILLAINCATDDKFRLVEVFGAKELTTRNSFDIIGYIDEHYTSSSENSLRHSYKSLQDNGIKRFIEDAINDVFNDFHVFRVVNINTGEF